MADTKIKAARLTPPMVELLTDIATHPQMYVRTYGRWGRTASALRSRGLATTEMVEGNQTEVVITQAGRAEAARRAIIPGRRQCRGCARSGGELTENGCPSCGPSAEIGIVDSRPQLSCTQRPDPTHLVSPGPGGVSGRDSGHAVARQERARNGQT